MEQQQQAALTRKLAALLGFADGADDILAQLLTIESSAVGSYYSTTYYAHGVGWTLPYAVFILWFV